VQRLGRFPCVTGRLWSVWASSALRCVQVSTARRLLLASTASCPGVYGCAGAAGSGFADARDFVCGAGGCLQALFVAFSGANQQVRVQPPPRRAFPGFVFGVVAGFPPFSYVFRPWAVCIGSSEKSRFRLH
jgi:hypothetical protein